MSRGGAGGGWIRTWMMLVTVVLGLLPLKPARAQDVPDPAIARDLRDLRDRNAETRQGAAQALANMAAAAAANPKVTWGGTRQFHMKSLTAGGAGNPKILRELEAKAVGPLLRALNDHDSEVRQAVARALGNIEAEAPDVLPALALALRDRVPPVRAEAALAIGEFRAKAQPQIPALVAALGDPEGAVRKAVARALGNAGTAPELAVPALAAVLKDDDGDVVDAASAALARFGPRAKEAVPALTSLLGEPGFRSRFYAAKALETMGTEAQPAVPALLVALHDESPQIRLEVAAALAGAGRHQMDALPVAVRLLSHENHYFRSRAAVVIGEFGTEGAPALTDLGKALGDPAEGVRVTAGAAIGRIAVALRQAARTDTIPALRDAQAALARSNDPEARTSGRDVAEAIASLEALRQRDLGYRLSWPVREQPVVTAIVLGYAALAAGWLVLLLAAPLIVLRAGEALAGLPRPRLPGWLGGVEVSLSSLLLAGFLQHRDRVLDAWVARALGTMRSTFDGDGTMEPMTLDGQAAPVLGPEALQPTFAGSRVCLLVVGDRDWAGKVAGTIARWAMEHAPAKRLRAHLMLPVRLEKDLLPATGDADPLVRAVRDLLPAAEAASEALVTALMRRQRILLIVMDLSERGESTRAAIRPGRADFAAHALAVTSRTDEALGNAPRAVIRQGI